jgi:hypothetical protein
MAAQRPAKQIRKAARPRVKAPSVFLNVPYDAAFENLLLADIAAVSAYGFAPRATLEIPFGERRLDRILALIRPATRGAWRCRQESRFLHSPSLRDGLRSE